MRDKFNYEFIAGMDKLTSFSLLLFLLLQEFSSEFEVVIVFLNDISIFLQNWALSDYAIVFLSDLLIVRYQVINCFSEFLIITQKEFLIAFKLKKQPISFFLSPLFMDSVRLLDHNIVFSEVSNLLPETFILL